jgi:hypothetical protein
MYVSQIFDTYSVRVTFINTGKSIKIVLILDIPVGMYMQK